MREVTCRVCEGIMFYPCEGPDALEVPGSVCPVGEGNGGECEECGSSGVLECEYCTKGFVCEGCEAPVTVQIIELGEWWSKGEPALILVGCKGCGWVTQKKTTGME